MKRLLLILSLVCAASAHAEMYKWVGPDGKIHYTDTPPPPAAKQVEKKNLGGEGSDLSSLPYELAEAARNNPVTLFTMTKCAPCNDGRAFLKTRGIPFSEKTVDTAEDLKKFESAAGSGNLPALVVGRNPQHGFEAGAWGSALTAAGYPASSQLPSTYRFAQPAAASPKAAVEKKETKEVAPPPAPAPAPSAAPPGFQF